MKTVQVRQQIVRVVCSVCHKQLNIVNVGAETGAVLRLDVAPCRTCENRANLDGYQEARIDFTPDRHEMGG